MNLPHKARWPSWLLVVTLLLAGFSALAQPLPQDATLDATLDAAQDATRDALPHTDLPPRTEDTAPPPARLDAGTPPRVVIAPRDVITHDVIAHDVIAHDVIAPRDVIAHDVNAHDVNAHDAGVQGAHTTQTDRPRSTGSLARVTLGLFAILALVVLGAQPAVRALERRAGLAMLTGSGVPFLALGFVARHPAVGILDDQTLADMRPFLEFGLAWIGFRVGTEFNVRHIDEWPPGTARLMFIESACAFLGVAVGTGLLLRLGWGDPHWVRNALILGACAAVSAPSGVRALAHAGLIAPEAARGMRRVASLDDVMALLVLALVTSTFRPLTSAFWTLPPVGWLFLQIGMGVVLGGLTVAALRIAANPNEEFAMTLGAVAFTAGLGTAVGFSPLVVACLAGVVVENLQVSAQTARSITSASRRREIERTVYLAFFVVVGAMWEPRVGDGWLLLPIYVFARIAGKLLGVRAAHMELVRATPGASLAQTDVRVTWVALLPSSAVSIALVVSAQASYPTLLRGSLQTVVIAGALASELLFRAGAWVLGGRVNGDDSDLGALALTHETSDEAREREVPQ
ncbi:MAG: cation:proton antiporter [Polyangiales bacterium]